MSTMKGECWREGEIPDDNLLAETYSQVKAAYPDSGATAALGRAVELRKELEDICGRLAVISVAVIRANRDGKLGVKMREHPAIIEELGAYVANDICKAN